ncbi:MAG: FHA domain-containing protein [bacterium]
MPQITVQLGEEIVDKYILKKRVIYIGRDKNNDIVLDNLLVSRKHAKIKQEKGGIYILTDLKTPNKTFLNGQEITECEIKDEDKISICHHTLLFNIDKRIGHRGMWKPEQKEGTMMFSSLQEKEKALKEEVENLMKIKETKEMSEKEYKEHLDKIENVPIRNFQPKPKNKTFGLTFFLILLIIIAIIYTIYLLFFQ